MIDATNAGNAIPGLNMAMGIPCQSRNHILLAHAEAFERLAQLTGAQMQIGISFAMNIAFDQARYDSALTVIDHCMIQNAFINSGTSCI